MNKVDIYINDYRLDLFDDEQISINLSVQNIQDIGKVFTDFTQTFTVPASQTNNEILAFYHKPEIITSYVSTSTQGLPVWQSIGVQWNALTTEWNAGGATSYTENTFDGRFRQQARIEINSLPFRTGVIEIENVQLKGTQAYSYSLTFYGEVVNLTDLFGEDYLYDLDFSEYNHPYTGEEILNKFQNNEGGALFYPLMSPVKNWVYHSGGGGGAHVDNNIAYHSGHGENTHGINYYELKPALKVNAVLTAIEQKYGIEFTGTWRGTTPFTDLSLWLHRREGYMYQNQPAAMAWEKVVADVDNAPVNDIYQFSDDEFEPTISGVYNFQFSVAISGYTDDWELAVIDTNGDQVVSQVTLNGGGNGAFAANLVAGRAYYFAIRPTTTATSPALNYQFTNIIASRSGIVGLYIDIEQTSSRVYGNTGVVYVSDLMPEIKVKDFLGGLIKMYNLVVVPETPVKFLFQPLQDWYEDGTDQNYQTYFDITQYVVNRLPLYRELEFLYQPTQQILGYEYRRVNDTGYGDLRSVFSFDGGDFVVQLPFECPLFERLTNQRNGNLTNVLVYKSITRDSNDSGQLNPYRGAPVLFYGYFNNYDLTANRISFVDEFTDEFPVTSCWYSNTSNRYSSAAASYTTCFGAEIDPYHLASVNRSLFNEQWSDYISDLYDKSRRMITIEAVLPIGKIITLDLKDKLIWNNTKYLINSVQVNMTTGRASFELLNHITELTGGISPEPQPPFEVE
jgi:hypothetical protein